MAVIFDKVEHIRGGGEVGVIEFLEYVGRKVDIVRLVVVKNLIFKWCERWVRDYGEFLFFDSDLIVK